MHERLRQPDVVYLYFAWGNARESSFVFDSLYSHSDTGELANMLLHPVIETRRVVRHIVEELNMAWKDEQNQEVVRRVGELMFIMIN
jgi:hypothetical protein